LDIARGLFVDAQGRAATPCSGSGPQDTDEATGGNSSQQSQSSDESRFPDGSFFDWSKAGTMTLDELPDSDLWYRPEYQLTQEWLENTIKYLRDIDEEKRVAAELEVADNNRVQVGTDMETG